MPGFGIRRGRLDNSKSARTAPTTIHHCFGTP
jgi:hypothetical protein